MVSNLSSFCQISSLNLFCKICVTSGGVSPCPYCKQGKNAELSQKLNNWFWQLILAKENICNTAILLILPHSVNCQSEILCPSSTRRSVIWHILEHDLLPPLTGHHPKTENRCLHDNPKYNTNRACFKCFIFKFNQISNSSVKWFFIVETFNWKLLNVQCMITGWPSPTYNLILAWISAKYQHF